MNAAGNAVAKASYTHEALCDLILARPWITQKEIAKHFGYTEAWVSQILSADAVKEYLIGKKAQIMDPLLAQAVSERLEGLAKMSMAVLQERLEVPGVSADLALKALEVSTRSLGYGAKTPGVQINQQFVVAMPAKEEDSKAWVSRYKPGVMDLPSS